MTNRLFALLLALLLALTAFGALAEETPVAPAAELIVPEEEFALGGVEAEDPGYADFVGEVAVSATQDIEINMTNFPDRFLRSYIYREIDNGDGVLSKDECAAVKRIEVPGNDMKDNCVKDMTGIEWFPNLELLDCNWNALKSLDVSKNTNLKELACGNGQLKSLNVSGCTALKRLNCCRNQLESLDVSSCTALTDLSCYGNALESLDVSRNAKLKNLMCDSNRLTVLDVTRNTRLTTLSCSENLLTGLDVSGCPKLEFLNAGGAYARLYFLPGTYDAVSDGNDIPFIDLRKCPALIGYASQKPAVQDGYARYGAYEDEWGEKNASIWVKAKTRLIVDDTDLAVAKVTVKDQAWTGKKVTPDVTVKLGGKTLKEGTDYTVSCRNNKAIGVATVTLKGKGGCTGSIQTTFNIVPKKVSGLKLTAGTKKIAVKWKKASGGVDGYQIEIGLKKDFSDAKTVKIKAAGTTEKTLKKLKSGKKYCVRIRAYKEIDGQAWTSKWSTVKSVRVK